MHNHYTELQKFLYSIISAYNTKNGINAVLFPVTENASSFSKEFLECLDFCDIRYSIFNINTLNNYNISMTSLSDSTSSAAFYALPINENASLFTYYTKDVSSLILCFSFVPSTYAKLLSLYSTIEKLAQY